MELVILATRSCSQRRQIARELERRGVRFDVVLFDEHPELVDRYDLHVSPNVLLDDRVVFRASDDHRVPSEAEIARMCELAKPAGSSRVMRH